MAFNTQKPIVIVLTPGEDDDEHEITLTPDDMERLIREPMVNIVLGVPRDPNDSLTLIDVAESCHQSVHHLDFVADDKTLPQAQIEALEHWALNDKMVPYGKQIPDPIVLNYRDGTNKQAYYARERRTTQEDLSPFHEIRDDYLGVAGTIAELVKDKRIVMIGGFGSGADFLARLAMQKVAEDDPRILYINQYTPVPAADRVINLTDAPGYHFAQFFGHAHIFRNFFDPVVFTWSKDLGNGDRLKEAEPNEAPIYNRQNKNTYQKLFHNPVDQAANNLWQFMNFTRGQANDSCLIITTAYDSPKQLISAIDRWGLKNGLSETIKNIPDFLSLFSKEIAFWSPLHRHLHGRTAEGDRLSRIGTILLQSWDKDPSTKPPEWAGKLRDLVEYTFIGDKGKELYRPAVWCRLLYHLHKDESIVTADEAETYAKAYLSRIQGNYNEMHYNGPRWSETPG